MSRDSHAFGTTILWKTQIIFLKMKCDDAQSLREKIRDMVKILLHSTNKKTSSKTQDHQSISKRLLELFIMEKGILCKSVLDWNTITLKAEIKFLLNCSTIILLVN